MFSQLQFYLTDDLESKSAASDASEDEGKANRSCYGVWHACELMMVFDASQIYIQRLVLHFRRCGDKLDER